MDIDLTVKINNQNSSSDVRIINSQVVVTWNWDVTSVSVPDSSSETSEQTYIDQHFYDVRIGTSSDNLSTSNFIGDMDSTGHIYTSERQYRYQGRTLERGSKYFGQIRMYDTRGETSGWHAFSFTYNRVPYALSPLLSPNYPSISDDISLSYVFFDNDGDTEGDTFIRWFRNGVHLRQLDHETTIESRFLSYGDVWSADILPHDGYEYGVRSSTDSVEVSTSTPVVDNLSIMPVHPTEKDILKASYELTADEDDSTLIRWYINDELQSDHNDEKFARMVLSVGDDVRFELLPYDGVKYGTSQASSTVTIGSSGFHIGEMRIEGRDEPLDLLTTRPVVSWVVHKPSDVSQQYVSVRIGTFAGSNNIYSDIVETSLSTWQVPANLLERGGDYYISVAASNSQTFYEYKILHFRLSSSRWENEVSNSIGWTIETAFLFESASTFAKDAYQIVRFQDGTKFGEVRIYADRVSFASDTVTESNTISMSGVVTLTITGKDDDVKVWVDRSLAVDGTGKFTETSSSRLLEIGTVTDTAVALNYKTFFYTTDGSFEPGLDVEWNDLQFFSFADFEGNEVKAVEGFQSSGKDVLLVGVNPHDENEGGSVYKISLDKRPLRLPTVNRTFTPINGISKSFNERYKAFSHARGGSLFINYFISNWDEYMDFTTADVSFTPVENNWELIQNANWDPDSNAGLAGIDEEGFIINTHFEASGALDDLDI
jgi:hypothetical protein